MAKETCSICLDNLTEENYQVICWNEHQLCRDCYQRHKRSRGSSCPECRGELINWDEPKPKRPRRCGICREEGHTRRTCARRHAHRQAISEEREREQAQARARWIERNARWIEQQRAQLGIGGFDLAPYLRGAIFPDE